MFKGYLVQNPCSQQGLLQLGQVAQNPVQPDLLKLLFLDPQLLKELANVIAEPFSIVFERSWRTGAVPRTGERPMSLQLSKRARRKTQGTTGWSASPPSWER